MKTDDASFQQWEHDLRGKDGTGERAALLEIQARLLRLALVSPTRPRPRAPDPRLSRADQIACYIAQNYDRPLTAEGIADNGNRSQVHWDLVNIQRKDYGGGEIWFDGKLLRKDGKFLPKALQKLN